MEKLKHILIEAKTECPIATQDINVNLKNRQKAIRQQNYGPLDPSQPNEKFWKKRWQSDPQGTANLIREHDHKIYSDRKTKRSVIE